MSSIMGPVNFEEPSRPGVERREFLKLMGAATAMAMTACTRNHLPSEHILSLRTENAERALGDAVYYTSAFPVPGLEQGIVVKTQGGRPIKIDGNPRLVGASGASSVFAQASVLDLYSPFRIHDVIEIESGKPTSRTWSDFESVYQPTQAQSRTSGAKIRALLVEDVNSPMLAKLLSEWQRLDKNVRIYKHTLFSNDNELAGIQLATGVSAQTTVHFENLHEIISMDCDFMGLEKGALTAADAFMQRRVSDQKQPRLILTQYEADVTRTGIKADQRHAMSRAEIEALIEATAEHILQPAPDATSGRSTFATSQDNSSALAVHASKLAKRLLQNLSQKERRAAILIGRELSPRAHELGARINHAIGAMNASIELRPQQELLANCRSIDDFARSLERGEIGSVLVLGGNPVYSAPRELRLQDNLNKVELTAHLTLTENETSASCKWHLPLAHFLESWGDVRLPSGEVSILQPVIETQRSARSALELVSRLAPVQFLTASPHTATDSGHQLVRELFSLLHAPDSKRSSKSALISEKLDSQNNKSGEEKSEDPWRAALLHGAVVFTKAPGKTVATGLQNAAIKFKPYVARKPSSHSSVNSQGERLELLITPDSTVWDGTFSENPWLQELPKIPSSLVWDNAVFDFA